MNCLLGDRARAGTSLAVVAPGIAEALFATAIGLVAAIPAVMAYNKLATSTIGRACIGGSNRLARRALVERSARATAARPSRRNAAE